MTSPRVLRRFSAVAAAASLALLSMAAGASMAQADSVVEGGDWGYEKVTPAGKGAGTLQVQTTFRPSPDGRKMLYSTTAPLASVPAPASPQWVRTMATRGEAGWDNTSVEAPFLMPTVALFYTMGVIGSSQSLEWLVQSSNVALTPGATEGGSNLYVLNTVTGQRHLIAASPEFSHFTGTFTGLQGAQGIYFVGNDGTVYFSAPSSAPPLVPGASPAGGTYRWTPAEGLSYVADDGTGQQISLCRVADVRYEAGVSSMHPATMVRAGFCESAISGGSALRALDPETNLTTWVSWNRDSGNPNTPVPSALMATSLNQRSAVFRARALFTGLPGTLTRQHLYHYTKDGDALTYIATLNANVSLADADLYGWSTDLDVLMIRSTEMLAAGGTAGQPNLYVWRRGSGFTHVYTSTVGSTFAGELNLRRVSGNDRYLAFTDDSTAAAASFGFDNLSTACSTAGVLAPCTVMYRLDLQTDTVDCVSCRTDGSPATGHAGTPSATPTVAPMDGYVNQWVADDGTTFFDTPDPLVADDVNGDLDTYAWRDGEVRMISQGTYGKRSRFVDITPDGQTVFFATNDRVLASDRDDAFDIYALRAGGGFDADEVIEPVLCTGSDCRGQVAAPPASPAVGSTSFGGDGNASPGTTPRAVLQVARLAGSSGATARLRVRVSSAGRVAVSGRMVRTAARAVPRAGAYTLQVRLTRQGANRLRVNRALRVKAMVAYRSRSGQSSRRAVTLTFKQPRAGRAASRSVSFSNRKGS